MRPLYSVEVTEKETAKFETEISEEDVHGNWKLKGEALHQSAVSIPVTSSGSELVLGVFLLGFLTFALWYILCSTDQAIRTDSYFIKILLCLSSWFCFSFIHFVQTCVVHFEQCSDLRL